MSDAPETESPRVATVIPTSVSHFIEAQRVVHHRSFLDRILGRTPVPKLLRKDYRSARADVAAYDVLAQLGPDWILRTCQTAEGNGIDHIVVGPPGIFSMVVRHQPGNALWIDGGILLADGERMPHFRDAEFSAVRLTQQLSDSVGWRVDVTPCLIVVDPRSVTVAKPPRRVAVMTLRGIRTWLKELPKALSDQELQALHGAVATHPDWVFLGDPHAPSAEALAMFRKVQAEVGEARHVRLALVTGVLVFLWLIAVVGVGGVTASFLAN
ncbi:MAG: hypothetical protein ABIW32_08660 [Terrimesophilobacter sp.]